MARGRMVSKSICTSKQIHDLPNDTVRFAFACAIPHLDVNGVMHGDPTLMKAEIFPRREELTAAMMVEMRNAWVDAELVIVFEDKGDEWLFFPGFDRHQVGLRKDREASSGYPAVPADIIRKTSGSHPASCRTNGIERNRKEGHAGDIEASQNGEGWNVLAPRIRHDLEERDVKVNMGNDPAAKTHGHSPFDLLAAWAEFRDQEQIETLVEKAKPPVPVFLSQIGQWIDQAESNAIVDPETWKCEHCRNSNEAERETCRNCARSRAEVAS